MKKAEEGEEKCRRRGTTFAGGAAALRGSLLALLVLAQN